MATQSVRVREYLRADGYMIIERPPEISEREVSAWRSGPAGIRQYINVWLPEIPQGETFETQESLYKDRFRQAHELHPAATNAMLVPTREGIRASFIREVRNSHRVAVRTPIEFFDTAFTWEGNDKAATITRKIRDEGVRVDRQRINQPFTAIGNFPNEGDDLVEALFSLFRDTSRPAGIHIVQGPAGIGKSWFFSSLFARLYDAFIQDKRQRRTLWARPLPLLPEYDPTGRRLSDLLSSFIRTEVDRPLRKEVLDWMVANRHGILMLDGLEEVMTLDEDFTDQILDYFTLPFTESEPTILICLRDSLMNRNQAVIDFCTEYADHTTVYKLEKWDDKSIRAFSERRIPNQEEHRKFFSKIQSEQALHEMASLPYYCDLLVQQFNDGQLRDTYSSAQLVEITAESMITREYAKDLVLSEEVLAADDVLIFAQDMAEEDLKGGFHGVPPSNITDWAQYWADLRWAPEEVNERNRFELQMSQIAFFEQGAFGRLKFVHEILELYLIGTRYVKYLKQGESASFIEAFSHWEFPANSITMEILSGYCGQEMNRLDIENLTFQSINRPKAFKNMLQLLSVAHFDGSFLGSSAVKKDLSGITFCDINLQGVSFAGCNLDTTEFHNCNLRDTDFTGAIISNTGFFRMSSESLEGTNFGDMNSLHSIRVDGRAGARILDEPKGIRDWLDEHANVYPDPSAPTLPCSAAEQLRHLFGKFIRPDGRARRSRVSTNVINRGTRYIQRPEDALDASVRAGYLSFDRGFHRYHRPDGPKYSEMVEFVRRFEASSDIRFLLDDTCEEVNCSHMVG